MSLPHGDKEPEQEKELVIAIASHLVFCRDGLASPFSQPDYAKTQVSIRPKTLLVNDED